MYCLFNLRKNSNGVLDSGLSVGLKSPAKIHTSAMSASFRGGHFESGSAISAYDSSSSDSEESSTRKGPRLNSNRLRRFQLKETDDERPRKRVRFVDGGIPGGKERAMNDKNTIAHPLSEKNGGMSTVTTNPEGIDESTDFGASFDQIYPVENHSAYIDAEGLKGPKLSKSEEDLEAELERFERSIAEDEEVQITEEEWAELEEKREEEVQRELLERVARLRQQVELGTPSKAESASIPRDHNIASGSLLAKFNENEETHMMD